MAVEAVPQPLLGFASDFPLHTILVALWDEMGCEVLGEVLNDRASFRDDQWFHA